MFPPKLLVSGFCAGAGIVFAVMMLLIKMEIVHTDEPRLTNPGIVSERPDFGPSQIRSLDQLRYGVPVMICRRDICSDVLVRMSDGSCRRLMWMKRMGRYGSKFF
ncbi:MAG: hypothetical protein HYT22_00135 [Candidatus Niyogibacteria bacterium]|nr:hypothetical protein [Candidatus Niyogibacteria bacterium]